MKSKDALSKELKQLHEYLYEKELERAMEVLDQSFSRWKKKELSVFELQEAIHLFYKGKSRQLYCIYEVASFADMNAARCINEGILSLEDLSVELRQLIEPKLKYV